MTKTIENNFQDWESNAFGFNYGSGEQHVLTALRRFLELCDRSDTGQYDYRVMEADLGAPVTWLLINFAGKNDLIEYGSSPRFGWLTSKGRALKKFMLSKSIEEIVTISFDGYDNHQPSCFPDGCQCHPNKFEDRQKCTNPFWFDEVANIYLSDGK